MHQFKSKPLLNESMYQFDDISVISANAAGAAAAKFLSFGE